MKQLDPKSVWLFFLNYLLIILIGFMMPYWLLGLTIKDSLQEIIDKNPPFTVIVLFFLMDNWLLIAVILIVFSYVMSVLTYRFYKYELREDGFRKEHGVIWKKYVTIPYERIQNIDIHRGLIARLLGLSDLNIQTAGMSSGGGSYGRASEGRIPGISPKIAEQLRDELVKRASGKHQNL